MPDTQHRCSECGLLMPTHRKTGSYHPGNRYGVSASPVPACALYLAAALSPTVQSLVKMHMEHERKALLKAKQAEIDRARLNILAVDPEAAVAAVEARGGHAGTYRYVADRLASGMTLERALEYLDARVADELVDAWEKLRFPSDK